MSQTEFFEKYYKNSELFDRALHPSDVHEFQDIFSEIFKAHKIRPTLIDVGCSYGRFALSLLKRGTSYFGLDPVSANVEKLISQLAAVRWIERRDFDEYVGTLDEFLAKNATKFDYVVSINTVHHNLDGTGYQRNVVRLLKETGSFIVIEPNPFNPLHWLKYLLEGTSSSTNQFLCF